MFKPHYGDCIQCQRKGLMIPVKSGLCVYCNYELKQSKKKNKPTQTIKKRKVTGEYKLFLEIYSERNGKCEVTGNTIPFDVCSFAHILGKGAYPSLRLNKENIILVKKDIHDLYDNGSKENLLKNYPEAIIIYERKDILKQRYYSS